MKKKPDLDARIAARQPDGTRPQIMCHRWESLLFVHWQISAATIQKTLPDGLTVDTYQGQAYLGLTPFFMRNVRCVGLPPLPGFSAFQELNVRTYVYDHNGVPGIWFYSLDCNQPVAVRGAQLLTGLPYLDAEMNATRADFISYCSRRRGSNLTARYRYRGRGPQSLADPGSLEFFLLERYYLFSTRFRSLLRAQVSHEPYRWQDVDLLECSLIPAQLDGLTELSDRPIHSCFVEGLDVKVYATHVLGRLTQFAQSKRQCRGLLRDRVRRQGITAGQSR